MKTKRLWTPEQRQAAAERMKKMSRDRWAAKSAPQLPPEPVVEGETAVAVLEPIEAQQMPVRDVTRVGSRDVVLRVKTDGTMASVQGPCVCGARKNEWHALCLRGS
jgi:hypothetical protein